MKVAAALLLSAGLASALPVDSPAEGKLIPTSSSMLGTIAKLTDRNGKLDAGLRPLIRNELVDGKTCAASVVFIFARASSEPNNMGASMGPWVCAGLKKKYGDKEVWCQGVGEPGYTAGVTDNIGGIGTSRSAIREATRLFNMAHEKCPEAAITFGGYSQGTAVMHNTVGALPETTKKQVVGGVLFGDTRNSQDRGQIKNYPKDNIKIFCDKDDGVCFGTLSVTNGHFVYTMNGDGNTATDFLVTKVKGYFKE